MRLRATLFLASALLLLLAPQPGARAQEEKPFPGRLNRPISNYYSVEAGYLESQAYAGNKNLELIIRLVSAAGVTVPESERLTLIAVSSIDDPGGTPAGRGIMLVAVQSTESEQITIKPNESGSADNEQSFRVSIGDDLAPKSYRLAVNLVKVGDPKQPKQPIIQKPVDLNVGTLRPGKLRLVETEHETLILGQPTTLTLEFVNNYAEYTAKITALTVRWPDNIVESLEVEKKDDALAQVNGNHITFTDPVSIDPAGAQGRINLVLKMTTVPSLTGFVMGYGDDTKLKLEVTYNDGHRRKISEPLPEVKVKVRPGDLILLFTTLAGVLVGTFIKFYLEYLRKRGMITKKGVAWFVVVTIVVGVVITIIAWAGEIQIIAFKEVKLSYDKPSVIFIIGLVGALTGVHYMQKLMKKVIGEGR